MTHAPQGDELSFDAAIPSTATHAAAGLTCANCGRAISGQYHTANGKPVCADCRTLLEGITKGVSDPRVIGNATVYGLAGAAVGAAIYWAVARYTGYEVALVAIVSGWLIGRAMNEATGGRGGRTLQLIGALLAYLSMAAAYAAMMIAPGELGELTLASVPLLLALPFMIVIGTLPGGIISLIILLVGMAQAWRMNAAPAVIFEGPFRVGDAAPPATS